MVWKVLTWKVRNTVVSRVGEENQLENSQENQTKNKISMISAVDKTGLVDLWHSLAFSKWEQAESGGLVDKSIYTTFWQILSKMCSANVIFFHYNIWLYFNVLSLCSMKAVLTAKTNNYWEWGLLSQNTSRWKIFLQNANPFFNSCPVHWD